MQNECGVVFYLFLPLFSFGARGAKVRKSRQLKHLALLIDRWTHSRIPERARKSANKEVDKQQKRETDGAGEGKDGGGD